MCQKSWRSVAPRALRMARANGIATPTMNMNAGWMRSQKAIHSHGLWSNWPAIQAYAGGLSSQGPQAEAARDEYEHDEPAIGVQSDVAFRRGRDRRWIFHGVNDWRG